MLRRWRPKYFKSKYMTKQKIIQEAYGEYWENVKDYVDENGWIETWDMVNCLGVIAKYGFQIKIKGKKNKHQDNLHRPKILQGIETNNGWIKIESEGDLPKETDTYWFVSRISGKIMKDYFTADSKVSSFHNCQVKLYSHYQGIEKPQPPIY